MGFFVYIYLLIFLNALIVRNKYVVWKGEWHLNVTDYLAFGDIADL